MISVNVLVDHKKWKKSLNKPQLFFDKILRRFPKKYFYSNKKVNFTLLLSNNTNIKKLNYKFRKKNNHTDVKEENWNKHKKPTRSNEMEVCD